MKPKHEDLASSILQIIEFDYEGCPKFTPGLSDPNTFAMVAASDQLQRIEKLCLEALEEKEKAKLMMKPKDFEKFRMKRPEGQPLLMLVHDDIMFSAEDRPTVEEAQRLRDEFAKNFPTLEEKLQELRAQAFQAQGS